MSLLISYIFKIVILSTYFSMDFQDPPVVFDQLFEDHGSVMLIIDVETGQIEYANQAASKFYGYSVEELMDMNIQNINTLSEQEVAQERNAAAYEKRNYFVFEHKLANGEIRTVEVYSYPYKYSDRKLLFSIIHDITPRIQAESTLAKRTRFFYIILSITLFIQILAILLLIKAIFSRKKIMNELKISENRYRGLFETIKEGFGLHEIICDSEGKPVDYRFLDVNPAFETLTGLKKQDILNKTIREVLPNIEEYWIELYGRVALTGEPASFENYSVCLGRYYQTYAFSLVKNQFVVVFSDISENKHNEAKILEEKERLRVTLHSIGDGVITTDNTGLIVDLNKASEEITGWKQEEAKGKHVNEIVLLKNTISQLPGNHQLNTALQDGHTIVIDNDTILITKENYDKKISLSCAPIKDVNEVIIGSVLVIRDTSEAKKREEEIIYVSFHDALTGLYNRRFFEEELKRLDIDRNLPLSVIIGDVNGLKLANDAFGHATGDKLLQMASEVMKNACRKDDIIARWGGDEFTILLPNADEKIALEILDRIKDASSKITVDSVLLSISLGCGTKKHVEDDIVHILKNAEDSMYREKLLESPSMKSKIISTIVQTLQESNVREERHLRCVSKISGEIGRVLGLSEIEIKKLELIGLVHDIGKIGINDSILNKPSSLTVEEWEEVKRHSEIGYRILSSSNDMSEIAEYVLSHHERWDGTGYPKGVSQDNIPLFARIITIADCYDAMISDRPYRKALELDEVIEQFKENSGKQFDPELIKIFVEKVINVFDLTKEN